MFCGHCGAQNPDDARFCEGCGGHLTPRAATAGGTTPHPGTQPQTPAVPVKLDVAQIMKAFCLMLILVVPVLGFYQLFISGISDAYSIVSAGGIANILDSSSDSADLGKNFLRLFTMRIALGSPLLILSVYSGFQLYSKKPGALALAKKFLLVLIGYLLCSHLVFTHFFGITEKFQGTTWAQFWGSVILLAGAYYFVATSKDVKDFYAVTAMSTAAPAPPH